MSEGIDTEKRATLRQFAALGAISPLARVIDTRSEHDSDAREAIIGYITATPGAHFSKIRDDLGLGTGETQHHIRRLIESGAIESLRDGDYRRFYPASQFSAFEQIALGYLRRATPRGMVIELLRDPAITGSEIATTLGVSPPTISKYASELTEAGLLRRTEGYTLVQPEVLLLLLVRYANSFDKNTVLFAQEAATLITVRQ